MTSPVEKAMQRNVTLTLYQTQDTELPLYPSAVDIVMRDVNTDALLGFMRLSRLCVEQDGAFYTVSSVASARGRQGLGYRLYLTAMAFVSQKGGYLSPDQSCVRGESISIWETMAKISEVTHRSLPVTVMTMEHFRDAELEELRVTNPVLTDADIDEMFESAEESLVEQMYTGTLTPHYLNCAYRLNRAFWDDILQSVQIEMTPPNEEEEQAMLKMWEVVYCNDEVWAEIDDVA